MAEMRLKQRVERFIARLAREDVNMHGFILSVGGKTKATAYYAPFREGQPHRMYSVSKTMTALALGMLMGEGKVHVDDHIVDYFRDELPENPDPRLMKLTIRDMLRMATCHKSTAYKEGVDENWARPFFTVTPTHEPGTMFNYDTGCSQVLSALVKRLSGQEVIDFLNERLFAPVGANDEKYWLRDPSGACQGGTGLCMSLRDLHRVAVALTRPDQQLVPDWFYREMTRKQIDTLLQTKEEETWGYGWQVWMTRAGWVMYGIGGQLAVVCPEKDVVLSTIADTRLDPVGLQRLYDAFFDEVYPFIGAEDMDECRWTLRAVTLPHDPSYAMAEAGPYRFAAGNMLGLRSLTLQGQTLRIENARGESVLRFGLGENVEDVFPGWPDRPTLCSGGWIAPGVLRIRCFIVGDAPCGVDMLLRFTQDCCTVQSRKSNDPATNAWEGVVSGYPG